MNKTTIEWTDYSWNPITGCTKVSRGCKLCYAEGLVKRFGKRWKMDNFRDQLDGMVHREFPSAK